MQSASAPAISCTTLDTCMQVAKQAALENRSGEWYESCDALRLRMRPFQEPAKKRLLQMALSPDDGDRNVAGCLLSAWPSWTGEDLPILKHAIDSDSQGGWIVRALANYPAKTSIPILLDIIGRDGTQNQAGWTFQKLMPDAVPELLRYIASQPPGQRIRLTNSIAFSSNATDGWRLEATERSLVTAATRPSQPMIERESALWLLAPFGEHARAYGPVIRPLANGLNVQLRTPAKNVLLSMNDISVLDEVLASCPPAKSKRYDDGFSFEPMPVSGRSNTRTDIGCFQRLRVMGKEASSAAPRLLPYLTSPSWKLRAEAAQTLGPLNNPSVAAHLHPLLFDADWQVVAAAIHAEVQLGDHSAIPDMRTLGATHWYGAIRDLATAAISAVASGKPDALDASYESAGFMSNLLWNNPLPMSTHACVSPFMVTAPDHVTLDLGELDGTDEGEFGGKLTWTVDKRGKAPLLESNINGMLKISGQSAWVVTGLSHMIFDESALYSVTIAKNGKASVARLLNLPTRATQLGVRKQDMLYRSPAGAFLISPTDSLGKKFIIRDLPCGSNAPSERSAR